MSSPGADVRGRSGPAAEEPTWDPDPFPSTATPRGASVPHVVAWNLTARCNLACPHCYISAGAWRSRDRDLGTDACLRVVDELLEVSPAPMLILSGGEPLVREDLETIAAHASEGGATVVVGTNGTLLTAERIASLREAGVRGVAVSIDSLRPAYHDRFRHGSGALDATLAAVERLREARLDFVVQTSLTRGNRDELGDLVAWSADRGAVAFNLYFLVTTGRGEGMHGLGPEENEEVLSELARLQAEYRGRLMVRSKCAPHLMRHVHRTDPDSPLLNYPTRCPCGVHYCRITPEGKVTPCPYLPLEAGDLRDENFGDVWRGSPLLRRLREEEPGGRCGRCEYRELCGGCRARAYAETDDVMAADPGCAYEPDGTLPVVRPPRPTTYGARTERTLRWSPGAEARLERIPSFVRAVVARRLEDYARERGERRVTEALMDQVRDAMPVDFSRARPFFLRDRT